MIFIIMKNDSILNISETLDNMYSNLLSYIRIILYCNNKKFDFFNDLKIIEYNNNCPSNSFKLNINTFELYSINNNKIIINNPTLENYRIELLNKINQLDNTVIESDINLFLPVNINNINSSDNMNIYIKSKDKIIETKTKEDEILQFKQKIELEQKKLEEHNNNYDRKLTKYLEDKHQIGLIESKLKIKAEREEEKKRIFKSDLHTYNCMIDEINKQTRDNDDIPDLFKNKFIIISKLHEDDDFINYDDSLQFEKYLDKSKELKLTNQFIKTKYDDMFNNITYNNSDTETDTENDNDNDNDNDNENDSDEEMFES